MNIKKCDNVICSETIEKQELPHIAAKNANPFWRCDGQDVPFHSHVKC